MTIRYRRVCLASNQPQSLLADKIIGLAIFYRLKQDCNLEKNRNRS